MPEHTDRDRDMALNMVEELEQLAVELPVYFGDWLERQFAQARREGMRQATQETWSLIQEEADAHLTPRSRYPYALLIAKFEERFGHLLDPTSKGVRP